MVLNGLFLACFGLFLCYRLAWLLFAVLMASISFFCAFSPLLGLNKREVDLRAQKNPKIGFGFYELRV